ncbi:MAG: hypothetical protein BWZ02_03133 [Lentisphaerae bacterium ADurb.BinA184]|nr:MAG: hypothetical protein BWZ02_03133 [Lentisphaerae bacterium ADurb.BinA184]
MVCIINGLKYDSATSRELYCGGDLQTMTRANGRLTLYRSPKGTVWATLYYWVSETADRLETCAGEAAVRRLCEGLNNARAIEAAFGKIEEG